MKPATTKYLHLLAWMLMLLTVPAGLGCRNRSGGETADTDGILLPEPARVGQMSLEEALALRRSIRAYTSEPISLQHLSQLLWAAQGITSAEGLRTAPSAGALYPLVVYVVAGNVAGLAPAIYTYDPAGHRLKLQRDGDARRRVAEQALDQDHIGQAAADIVIAAEVGRTTATYDERGLRYVYLEAGHAGQNLCLQAESLGLGTCPVGAFEDEGLREVLGLPQQQVPLYIFPVGMVSGREPSAE